MGDEELEARAAGALRASLESNGAVEAMQMDFSVLQRWTDGFAEAKKIGEGGFGSVFVAEVPGLGAVAVKVVSKGLELAGAGRTEALGDVIAAMRREIQVLNKIRHPNVIRLLGYSMPTTAAERERAALGG
jgi:hypothetical protein